MKKRYSFVFRKSSRFFLQWLEIRLLKAGASSGRQKLLWVLPKKYIRSAVLRNRLKRWGRENLRRIGGPSPVLIVFLKRDKNFYKNLRRRDFDAVFLKLLRKISSGQDNKKL